MNAHTFKVPFFFHVRVATWNRSLYLEKPVFGNNLFSLLLSPRDELPQMKLDKENKNLNHKTLVCGISFIFTAKCLGPAA